MSLRLGTLRQSLQPKSLRRAKLTVRGASFVFSLMSLGLMGPLTVNPFSTISALFGRFDNIILFTILD
jgi:hypothetical protein